MGARNSWLGLCFVGQREGVIRASRYSIVPGREARWTRVEIATFSLGECRVGGSPFRGARIILGGMRNYPDEHLDTERWSEACLPPFERRVLDLIAAVRDVPFAFVPDRDVKFMLRHGIGSCSAKHELLLHLLRLEGWTARLVYITLRYNRDLLPLHGVPSHLLTSEPYPHTAVQLHWDGQWHLIDITLDRFVSEVAPVFGVSCRAGESIGTILNVVLHSSDNLGRREHLQLADRPASDANVQYFKAVNKYFASVRKPRIAEILAQEAELKRLVTEVTQHSCVASEF